jgi:ABC-type branched-subunit amino acid transport system substrate-binding protein
VLAAAAVGLPFRARAAAREIQIAMLLPLQGGQARQAEMIRQGVDGALEQANRAGGIRGQPVKLLAIDNGYQAEKTVEAIGSLAARESVVAVTSLFGGPIIGAAIPAATRAGVPIVGVLHGNDAFRRPGTEIVTHVRATFDAETRAIAALFPTIGRSRFAVLHATDNSGTAFRAQFESVLKAQGLPLVAAVPYARDATDYTEQARSIERSGADVVVVGGVTATGIAAIRAKVATKLWAQMVCLSTVDERSVWEQVGADAVGTAFSSVVPNPYATLLPLAREYQAAMKARNYDRLSLSSFEGYINAQVLHPG